MSHKHKEKNKGEHKELNYKFYFGIPHAHTSYSTGRGTPEDALNHTKLKGLHYLIITDHNRYLHKTVKDKKEQTDKWSYLKIVIQHFNKKNKYFIGISGFEVKIKSIGDLNIINSKTHIKGSIREIDKLLSWLKKEKCIGIINHPGSSIEKIKSYSELNEYVKLIEVGNGSPPFKYTRYLKYYFRLLDAGWKLGAVNGQDNHLDNWGESSNLTVVLAEKLSSKHILEGLRNRRTYSTESRTLKLMYKINGAIMGSTISANPSENLSFLLYIEDIDIPLETVQIISRGGKIVKEFSCNRSNKLKCEFKIPAFQEEDWYVVKVLQEGNKLALSSPIFIQLK